MAVKLMHVSSQHVWAWLAAISLSLMHAGTLPAQSLWEVTPYQVHVWMALASDPDVPVRWRD
jgi:hypothetical protein